MPKSQLSKHQFIFDILLDDFLLQCTIKSNFTGSNIIYLHACIDYLSIILITIPDLRLLRSLEKLNKQLFYLIVNRPMFESWWQTKHLAWVEELNTTISYYRNIQSHYYEDLSEREIFNLYCDTNIFLIEYLERTLDSSYNGRKGLPASDPRNGLSRNHKLTIALRRNIETVLLSSEAELSQRLCKSNKRSTVTYK